MITGSLLMSKKAELENAQKELTDAIQKAVHNPEKHKTDNKDFITEVEITLSEKTLNTLSTYLNQLITKAEENLNEAQCEDIV